MRNGRYEVGFGGVQLLEFGDVVEDDQVTHELLFASTHGRDVERCVVHLEIALLVVGVYLQRLLLGVFPFVAEFAQQTAQQVVGQGYLGRVPPDDVFRKIQHRKRFAVHEKDGLFGIESDDRLVERVYDRFDAFFRRHQVVERTAAVLVEFGGHVVERLGDGFEFAVARKVEPLPVVVVGDLLDTPLQGVDRPEHRLRKPDQDGPCAQDAQCGHDDQPPHHVVGALLHPGAFAPDGGHVQLHDPEEILAHGLYFGFGDGVAQRRDMPFERRGHLLFADLGDVLLLQGETLPQDVPRYRIVPDVVQRPQHVPGVLQRIVVVGQYGPRGVRKLPDVTDRLDSEQQDHGEQRADSQGEPSLYFHGLRHNVKIDVHARQPADQAAQRDDAFQQRK